MGEKQKMSKKQRAHKESQHTGRGAKPVRLDELQKILLVNGGMAHHLRPGKKRLAADQTKAGKKRIAEASARAAEDKKKAKEAKLRKEATRAMIAGAKQ